MSDPEDYRKQRRNTYGEAPHAARKAIPRGKQRQNQKQRRLVTAELSRGEIEKAEDAAARSTVKNPYRKVPDEPLAEVLLRRLVRELVTGRISASTFRRKVEPLRSYPGFVTCYRAICHGLSHVQLPAQVELVLAELK